MYGAIFLITLFIGFLTGCQSSVVQEGASVYRVPNGATVIVHKDIQLIPGKTKAFIQHGRLVETLEFGDLFFPHCIFEVGKGRWRYQVRSRPGNTASIGLIIGMIRTSIESFHRQV